MKAILINTPKGQFFVPLMKVAESRANHYVSDKTSQKYEDEVDYIMSDNYEGIDWLINNTDWEDWTDIAIKVNDKVKVLEDDFWTDTEDFEVVESSQLVIAEGGETNRFSISYTWDDLSENIKKELAFKWKNTTPEELSKEDEVQILKQAMEDFFNKVNDESKTPFVDIDGTPVKVGDEIGGNTVTKRTSYHLNNDSFLSQEFCSRFKIEN